MGVLIDKINKITNLNHLKGCSLEEVKKAQSKLNMVFPVEYVEYLQNFGVISFYGTEWTGLGVLGYLNVVESTEKEMKVNPNFPKNFFVLEDLGIDGKKVIVDERGSVFILQQDNYGILADSISDYLDICIKREKL